MINLFLLPTKVENKCESCKIIHRRMTTAPIQGAHLTFPASITKAGAATRVAPTVKFMIECSCA